MKKLILLLFLSVVLSTSFSQQFVGLPTSNAEWIISEHIPSQSLNYNSIYLGDTKFFVNGDTTINNVFYHKIYEDSAGIDLLSLCFKNDYTNKKIFIYDLNAQAEYLWFDFSKQVGDTIHNVFFNNTPVFFKDLIVKKTDSIFINGNYYKRVKLTDTNPDPTSTYVWIDGFGKLVSHFLNPKFDVLGNCTNCYHTMIKCMTINGNYYQLQPYDATTQYFVSDSIALVGSPCTYQPLQINEIKVNDVTIYPNPVNHYVNINLPDLNFNHTQISIYDINGKMVYKSNSISSHYKIDISNLKPGLYFVKVNIDDKTIYKKINVL